MSIRYIFNTNGEYVAFVQGRNVFTPETKWIGFLPEANIVYKTDGTYLGEISKDDRIIRNENVIYPQIFRPLQPLPPLAPLRPLRRLRMPSLPYPYKDVFEIGARTGDLQVTNFSYLFGTKLFASDNKKTFLGEISRNKVDQNSILNAFGHYGSKYSQTSIFNQFSQFGGKYGLYSPLNTHTITPPQIYRDNQMIALLTVNVNLVGKKVNTKEFFRWLSSIR